MEATITAPTTETTTTEETTTNEPTPNTGVETPTTTTTDVETSTTDTPSPESTTTDTETPSAEGETTTEPAPKSISIDENGVPTGDEEFLSKLEEHYSNQPIIIEGVEDPVTRDELIESYQSARDYEELDTQRMQEFEKIQQDYVGYQITQGAINKMSEMVVNNEASPVAAIRQLEAMRLLPGNTLDNIVAGVAAMISQADNQKEAMYTYLMNSRQEHNELQSVLSDYSRQQYDQYAQEQQKQQQSAGQQQTARKINSYIAAIYKEKGIKSKFSDKNNLDSLFMQNRVNGYLSSLNNDLSKVTKEGLEKVFNKANDDYNKQYKRSIYGTKPEATKEQPKTTQPTQQPQQTVEAGKPRDIMVIDDTDTGEVNIIDINDPTKAYAMGKYGHLWKQSGGAHAIVVRNGKTIQRVSKEDAYDLYHRAGRELV